MLTSANATVLKEAKANKLDTCLLRCWLTLALVSIKRDLYQSKQNPNELDMGLFVPMQLYRRHKDEYD